MTLIDSLRKLDDTKRTSGWERVMDEAAAFFLGLLIGLFLVWLVS
jgi:hypothetical protein